MRTRRGKGSDVMYRRVRVRGCRLDSVKVVGFKGGEMELISRKRTMKLKLIYCLKYSIFFCISV